MTDDLLSRHDVLLADLDGTLYRGPGRRSRARSRRCARRPSGACAPPTSPTTPRGARPTVAEHLAELGFPRRTEDVVASSQAAAAMLAEQLPAGARVLVVGHRRAGRAR